MGFPKLKYPRLCRLIPYVVVLGLPILIITITVFLPVSDAVKVVLIMGYFGVLLWYLFVNFPVLMSLDILLAILCCHRTARKQYILPSRCSAGRIVRGVSRYGTACEPTPIEPRPSLLRYRFSSPMTVYSRGIERVIASYEVDYLDKDTYGRIFHSAKNNSTALIGRKKALFLDKSQKKEALHRVTVILILAHSIDPRLVPTLYDLVCMQCGDEEEDCVVPCVVDLTHNTCVFNSLRVPYIGFGYPVKNRGIRLIKRLVFGGNLNLRSNNQVIEFSDINPEDSVWSVWGNLRRDLIQDAKEEKKRCQSMTPGEIRIVEDMLYFKWDERCVSQMIAVDTDHKTVKIHSVTNWAYPKPHAISKKCILEIERTLTSHFARQGYSVSFVELDDLM